MKSKLYFTSLRSSGNNRFFDRFKKILKIINFESSFNKNDFVAIKTHFGELGNVTYVHPAYIRFIVQYYRNFPIKLFITDTNTIYVGHRHNAVDHLHNAFANGFSYSTIGVPVIIGDGLLGLDYIEKKIDAEIFKNVKIAKIVKDIDKMIVVSHIKGHLVGGFGGALKNLGMGLAPRPQKYAMHASMNPKVNKKKCIGCGKCLKWCPVSAISITNHKAFIDDKCVGCGECIEVCPESAIEMDWDKDAHVTQKAWVETALGVIKEMGDANILYINFINNVTPDCDCFSHSDNAIVPDIGVLVGTDPVSIDLASVELVNNQQGNLNSNLKDIYSKDKFKDIHPNVNWRIQIDYAEKLGLGSKEYTIENIEK